MNPRVHFVPNPKTRRRINHNREGFSSMPMTNIKEHDTQFGQLADFSLLVDKVQYRWSNNNAGYLEPKHGAELCETGQWHSDDRRRQKNNYVCKIVHTHVANAGAFNHI
ncbi:MAG: hypothetical protein WBS20_08010 [Lysobacterales bacterium]